MLVVVAGRKSSGKTTIADYLRNRGYRRASFAGRLKKLTAAIYGWSEEDLWTDEGKESLLPTPVDWGRDEADKLGAMIGAKRPLLATPKQFFRRREALQYIGTDVLREYDQDFHVNSLKEDISDGQKYVLDDCRFLNELQFCREMGCLVVLIVRPGWYRYSNHRSEIELKRRHFRNIIVNDGGAEDLVANFDQLHGAWRNGKMKLDLEEKKNQDKPLAPQMQVMGLMRPGWFPDANEYFATVEVHSAYWAGVLSATGKIGRHPKYGLTCVTLATQHPSLCRGFLDAIGHPKEIKIAARDGVYSLEVTNPFMIEDLKLWGQRAEAGGPDDLPHMVADDPAGLCHWLAGYFDGCFGPGSWPYTFLIPGEERFLDQLKTVLMLDANIHRGSSGCTLVVTEDSSYSLMKRLWDTAGHQLETVKRLV